MIKKIRKNVFKEYARIMVEEAFGAIASKIRGKKRQCRLHVNGCKLACKGLIKMAGGK